MSNIEHLREFSCTCYLNEEECALQDAQARLGLGRVRIVWRRKDGEPLTDAYTKRIKTVLAQPGYSLSDDQRRIFFEG